MADPSTPRHDPADLAARLWRSDPELRTLLARAPDLEAARDAVFELLARRERRVFDRETEVHPLELAQVRESVRVMLSLVGPCNEEITGVSALESLWLLARGEIDPADGAVAPGFLIELEHLSRGTLARSGLYGDASSGPEFLQLDGRAAARQRMAELDRISAEIERRYQRVPTGLDPALIDRRAAHRRRVLDYFGASEDDWDDYRWQLRHVIKRAEPLLDLVALSLPEREAVRKAVQRGIPFGITPYYLSLMEPGLGGGADAAIRAQVIPPPEYVDELSAHKGDRLHYFDFMGERDTSPVDLITRRYPRIAIFKPYNTCAQICVYCQRNWEIDECMATGAMAGPRQVDRALEWLRDNPAVQDVLVTGGDPGVLGNRAMERLLERICAIDHIVRIRLGTRTPVVLPQRWQGGLADVLARFHRPGTREIAVVTHFEHPAEITPEAQAAVQAIVQRGMRVYNQQVFTVHNSRRWETARLREQLRLIGVDPYYTFNMKGKQETRAYMVPIARILQERKEEARLQPGLTRTDEPVFNVPRLGKNHLRAWQDHRVIMIRPDNGARIYEFHPWEKYLAAVPPYVYEDVPILDYLDQLAARGEDPSDYESIWYYY